MPEPAERAAHALHTAIESFGQPATLEGSKVIVPALHLEVRIVEVDVHEGGAVVLYNAGSPNDERDGVQTCAIGFGDDAETAFGEAVFQWTTGVFFSLRHWLNPRAPSCFDDDAHMPVRDAETNEKSGWRVHLGPILSQAFGPDKEHVKTPTGPKDVFKRLFDDIRSHAVHDTLFWIEAYVIRYADGDIDSTCRFRNEPWPEGELAMSAWAGSWDIEGDVAVSVRQFLLFEPILPDTVPDRRRKPWWRRMLGR